MIMIAVAVAALLVVPLVGGDLRRLGQVHFRAVWLLLTSLILQVVILTVVQARSDTARAWLAGLHIATYVMAAVFVGLNWRIPGLVIVGLGGLSNGVTIALNGGTLPASPTALRTAGLTMPAEEFANSAALQHPRLPWLGDIWAIPQRFPLSNVFSIGDVLIWIGVVVAVYGLCVRPTRRPLRRGWGKLPPVSHAKLGGNFPHPRRKGESERLSSFRE
jgi:hypothetical protein